MLSERSENEEHWEWKREGKSRKGMSSEGRESAGESSMWFDWKVEDWNCIVENDLS